MKYFIILLSVMTLTVVGCKKEQPKVETPVQQGTLEVKFISTINRYRNPLVLGEAFSIGQGNRKAVIDEFKHYVSSLVAVKENGETVALNEVALVDFAQSNKTSHGEGITFSMKLPVGKYKGIRFRMGLDSLTNHSDPAKYGTGHPLSTSTGMHWTWKSGYKFTVLEGKVDASATGGQQPTTPFSYHTGTDELAFTQDFTNSTDHAFEVKKDDFTHFIVEWRADQIFTNGGDDYIDVRDPNNLFTHSFPATMSLSRKVNSQLKLAMKAYLE
jgi:hypothetical protein